MFFYNTTRVNKYSNRLDKTFNMLKLTFLKNSYALTGTQHCLVLF